MSLLSKIWNKIIEFFSSEYEEPLEKDIPSTPRRTTNRKKFQIKNQRRISIKKEKFSIINSSRPRSCPRCNSTGTIVKYEDKWKCDTNKNGCGYIW